MDTQTVIALLGLIVAIPASILAILDIQSRIYKRPKKQYPNTISLQQQGAVPVNNYAPPKTSQIILPRLLFILDISVLITWLIVAIVQGPYSPYNLRPVAETFSHHWSFIFFYPVISPLHMTQFTIVLSLSLYIWALIRTVRRRQYVWFLGIAATGMVVLAIYLIRNPD